MQQAVPETVVLKDPKQFKLIGKPIGRLDAKAKSTGTQDYGIDAHLPGMLTAVIARPPVFGAKIKSVDDSAAKAIKGVQAVLRIPGDRGGESVAIIANGYWPAKQGRDALKIEWDTSAVEKVDSVAQLASYKALAKQAGNQKYKDDISALATAPHQIKAEFVFPYLAHTPMEPLNCTVAIKGDSAEVWTGTQMPGFDGWRQQKYSVSPLKKCWYTH
jgi:isoquinoline 1-oxidoreductase beta subunit